MRPIIIFIALLVCPVFADSLPAEAKHLELIKEKEIAKIEEKYQAAMRKLVEKYTKAGNLSAANAINKRVTKKEEPVSPASPLIGSKWEYRIDGRLKSVFTLKSFGKIDATKGYKGVKWSPNPNGIFTIEFNSGGIFPVSKDGTADGKRKLKRIPSSNLLK